MMFEAILISSFTLVTGYQPKPEQTKPACKNKHECTTSIGENVSMLGAAVSPDLLESGKVRYRDVLFVPGVGYRIVNDCTNRRLRNTVDIFVYTLEQEKILKPRRMPVWVVHTPYPTIKKKGQEYAPQLPQQEGYAVTYGQKTRPSGGVLAQQERSKATPKSSSRSTSRK